MFLGLTLQQWMGFTVAAAIISTIGSLAGVILKDYFFARSLEIWKQKRTLEQIYQKYKDPLLLSSRELCLRVAEILKHYPSIFLTSSVLSTSPSKQLKNDISDPYFQKYKLVSTVYRMCSFLGWLELYRQDVVFLRSGEDEHSKKLECCIKEIRADLADGQLNTSDDWPLWRDTLIFREELRAIGESMIDCQGSSKVVFGYARFNEIFDAKEGSCKRWVNTVVYFFLDLESSGKDFRKIRLQRLVVHLVDLIELLENDDMEEYFDSLRLKYKKELEV